MLCALSCAFQLTPSRRGMIGKSLPCWLIQPGRVLLRRFVRNKNQLLVDKVELMETNLNFAHIRFPDGWESTVSVTDLAPYPSETTTIPESTNIVMKLRTMSSQPLPPTVLHFIMVRAMNTFHQTLLMILFPLLPHPQTTLLDLTPLTFHSLSFLSCAAFLEIPALLMF